MNCANLLTLYERVADAPDAVPKLRRFVLDLAVRGKLVEQDPNDDPASGILSRIAKEKIHYGSLKKCHRGKINDEPVALPYKLPESWKCVALSKVFIYDAGTKRNPATLDPTYWLLELEDIEKHTGNLLSRRLVASRDSKSTKSEFKKGDILLGKLAPYLNKVLVADKNGYSTTEIVAIRPIIPLNAHYCAMALRSPDFVEYVTRLGQGTTMPRLRTVDALRAPFPLPPIAEQRRIVAKANELLALCDKLEDSRIRREETRDRLTRASFARLGKPDADLDTFRAHARFAINVLPKVTARSDQIDRLRQTILALAVCGRLVEQDPRDEPAESLLQFLASNKTQFSKTKKSQSLSALKQELSDQIPYRLPLGWEWSTVGEICSKTGSGSTPRGGQAAYKSSGVPFLRSQNIHDEGLQLSDVAFIDKQMHKRMSGTAVLAGDLLLNITGGSIGRCSLVPDDLGPANISQHVSIVRTKIDGSQRFLHYWIRAPYIQKLMIDEQTGAGRGGLPKYKMDQFPVPLPPLGEQQRIVAKVNELMELCNDMETKLFSREIIDSSLLDSIIYNSLNSMNFRRNSVHH